MFFLILCINESFEVEWSVNVCLSCSVRGTLTGGGWQATTVAYLILWMLLFFNLPSSLSQCFSFSYLNFSQLWHVNSFLSILTAALILQRFFLGVSRCFGGSFTDTTVLCGKVLQTPVHLGWLWCISNYSTDPVVWHRDLAKRTKYFCSRWMFLQFLWQMSFRKSRFSEE